MATRITDELMRNNLAYTHNTTGLYYRWQSHNSRGYGTLQATDTPDDPRSWRNIAGSLWSGINRECALAVLEGIANSHRMQHPDA